MHPQLAEFIAIKKSDKKVKMYAVLMGIDPSRFSKASVLATRLREEIVKFPQTFLDLVKDPHQQMKYEISLMLSAKILKTVGTRYLVTESSQEIGANLQETVLNLSDPGNSQMLGVLRASLRDAEKSLSLEDL